jgi:acetyltransferase-like isoleucine patch superfamily enzyme
MVTTDKRDLKTWIAAAWREGFYLPYRFADKLRTAAAMHRHRRFAAIWPGAKVLSDGWIENSAGPRERLTIGAHSVIRGSLIVFPHAGTIRIGEWSFVGPQSYIWSAASIAIGDRCLISHQVNIHDTNSHSFDARLRHAQFRSISTVGHPMEAPDIHSSPIVIGDDVWIGFGASINKGLKIGSGAIVAACSLVLEDVEPWTVVAGNPARVVRKLEPN